MSDRADNSGSEPGDLARARLAAIVDSSDDAIVSKNLNGIIESWNAAAARLFGYTAEQAIGRSITMLMPPERINEEELILARLRAGERVEHFDTVRVRSDGRRIHVSLTISPVVDESGRIVGASKIVRDVTERKELEKKNHELLQQLKETDRRRSEFLAMLSHELRNPLGPIRNAVKVLQAKQFNDSDLNWCAAVVDRQADHLSRLVDDLLDATRITRNKLELRTELVELQHILEGVIETCATVVKEQGHELSLSLPPEPVWLNADVVRLSQVFTNLVNNAAKFTKRGGDISITAKRNDHDVTVSVTDTGIGIHPEKLPNLFALFYQIDGDHKRSDGGLGIGLALASRLVEMHGGSVTAHSEGVGRGSEFVVHLPLAAAARAQATMQADPPPEGSVAARRILIVDDNVDAAASLAMLFRLTGDETRTAHDGLEAVEVAKTFRPDVVLLDIGLPKIDGLDACRRIRAEPWGAGITLIALTGWGQAEDQRKSKDAGFDYHLVKPVEFSTLTKILNGK